MGPAPRDSLKLLDLEDTSTVRRANVLPCPLTMLLKIFVHVQQQLLDLDASMLVLLVKARTDAQMKRLFRLFLLGTLFEARALPSKT